MAIISIRGFRRTFGNASEAPPNFLPAAFFWLNSRTEFPKMKKKIDFIYESNIIKFEQNYLTYRFKIFVILLNKTRLVFFFYSAMDFIEELAT